MFKQSVNQFFYSSNPENISNPDSENLPHQPSSNRAKEITL